MSTGHMTLTVTGRLTADPELRVTGSGLSVAQFTIAHNARQKGAGGWEDLPPSFVLVQCWRKLAEACVETLRRGTPVIATGNWGEDHWTTDDGTKRSRWLLNATAVGVNLALATPAGAAASTSTTTQTAPHRAG